MVINDDVARQAADYLIRSDPILSPVITRSGLCNIRQHHDYYSALVGEIIGQQLSVKAAAAIRTRFNDLFGGVNPAPEAILQKAPEELRSAGLSWAKAKYIQDLARHIIDDKIDFQQFDRLSNEEIITELTDVKGIGEWTAHMFLMFCMGRSDVLPVGDLGIRNGIWKLYGLDDLPGSEEIRTIASDGNWHPYESVASWYIWESLDNKPDA